MIGLLVVGFVANELVRPVHPRHHEPRKGRPVGGRARRPEGSRAVTVRRALLFALVWLWVGIPFIYGLYELTLKLKQLFTG